VGTLIVQISKRDDGSYFCFLVEGEVSLQTDERGVFFVDITNIRMGEGVNFSKKMARDFVQEWILEKLRSTKTRFDRILERS
jgi:hypothetical protein